MENGVSPEVRFLHEAIPARSVVKGAAVERGGVLRLREAVNSEVKPKVLKPKL